MGKQLTRRDWAKRINDNWDRLRAGAVDAFIVIGHDLREAKDDLNQHGAWGKFVENDLKFHPSVARLFMRIANWADNVISDYDLPKLLPPDYGTVDKIARLPDLVFKRLVKQGVICPKVQRAEIAAILKKEKRTARERELGQKQQALPDKKYGVIYADPPWRFEPYSRETGMDRAADNHYETMELDDIIKLEVPAAKDAVLFLWATVPMERQAHEVLEAWRFVYKTQFIWNKDKRGTGYWNRNKHEILLVGVRGDIPAPASEKYDSVIDAPVGKHSEKPAVFRKMIEEIFPSLPRLEMFARQRSENWDSWGNEITLEAAE